MRVGIGFLALWAGLALVLSACSEAGPPDRYVVQGTFENAGVQIKVNGIPLWTEEREDAFSTAQQINAFLKPGPNDVEFLLRAADPTRRPKLGLIIGRAPLDGGSETEVLYRLTEAETARLPYSRIVTIDAPGFPELVFWKAQPAPADAAAREAIAADLGRIRAAFAAALEQRNAEAIADVMMKLPAGGDLARSTNPETVDLVRKGMRETMEEALADPDAQGSTVTAPSADDLILEAITSAHLRVRRADGGPVAGVVFVRPDDRPVGLFIERPVYGRVGGQWLLLRN